MGVQNLIDLFAECIEALPALIGEGFGDARGLGNAPNLHVESEFRIGLAEITAGNRRGIAEMRRCRQRNMALAGQKPRSGVETDPAGARHIDLGPGMQIGEIDLCP
ncbi:hypothetical protein D3C87_1641060 [compost metagenome]